MKGSDVASSPLLYVLIVIGLASIIAYALICYRRAKRCCLEHGISEEKIKRVVRSTISASIVPSIAILIGFLILSASLGAAWPWWRLSVLGALQYETVAAEYTVQGIGIELSDLLSNNAEYILAVMIVMSIGFGIDPFLVGVFGKKYATGMMKVKEQSDWGTILTRFIPAGGFRRVYPYDALQERT